MWLDSAQEWMQQGEACVLATVIATAGPAPRKPGAKLVVSASGRTEGSVGGGAIEHRCREEAARVLASSEPSTLGFVLDADWRDLRAGESLEAFPGSVTVFLEPLLPAKEVVAFGAGHIAEHLARLCEAVGVGFRVYDSRPELARRERFPHAREIVCADYTELASHLRLSSASHCIVLTHAHDCDEQVLEQLLRLGPLPYVGMVGSARKVKGIRERLAAKGIEFGPEVHAPAGLALGGSLPGDIALSILAEIKLVMEGGRPGHMAG